MPLQSLSSISSRRVLRPGAWSSFLTKRCSWALAPLFVLPVVAQTPQYNGTIFGPNVYVFSPSVPESAIEAQMTKLAGESQFSTNRYAVLFQPGSYTVKAPVGFYESVSGLGQIPMSTSITGFLTPDTDSNLQANLTDYFWRSLENLSVTATPNPQQGVQDNTFMWGVSQGAPLRRMQFNGPLQLTNEYCGWTSGGFISDTSIAGDLNFCSQQQWFTRNSSIAGKPLYGNWNMVFAGVTGAPATSFPTPAYTTLPTTPVSREKPFLYMDDSGNYRVFIPAPQAGSSGTSWSATSMGPGTSQPIAKFFIAQPSDSADAMNTALASGLNLILTPGIYPLTQPLLVTNPNTVILGMGYADLVPQKGSAAIQVADVDGVQIAGLLIDAGPVNSPVLLQLGTRGASRSSHHANPTAVDDVFVRIGGPTAGSATTSIEVDSDDVILDDIWAWRADHGPDNPPAGALPTFGWTANPAAHGLVVNGDSVTAMGLAVEHYQQEQVLWNGDNGQTIFFQSELPYDVPSQAAWMDGSVDGYPAYVVAPNVLQHQGYGLGVYSNFTAAPVVEASAISVPDTPGVTITDSVIVFLNSLGSITHIVNDEGDSVQGPKTSISYLRSYGGQPCVANCAAIPATPASLIATAATAGQINLSWTDATPGVYYTVYRSPTSGFVPSPANLVATSLGAPAFSDTGLTASTAYFYAVTASNATGTSAASAQATATTYGAGACITVPQTPQTVLAEQTTASQNAVTWGTLPASNCAVTYNVFRSLSGAGVATAASQIATGITLSSFDDPNLTAPAGYFYSVQAVDTAGASAPSDWSPVLSLSNWTEVWADDFSGAANTTFDSTKWVAQVVNNTGQNPFGDGTIMSTTASLQNAYQDGNGDLVIAMTYDAASGRYSAARLVSAQPIGPYGRIEARIITPSAQGMGSAFWSQGSTCFGANPTSYWPLCGELDIEESQALNPGHTATTIHGLETDAQVNYEYGGISAPVDLPLGETLSQSFHTYAVQWAPYHLQYFLDGKQYGDVTLNSLGAADLWAFNAPINFILSSGVGGNGGQPNGVGFPSNLTFDYVHYSQWAAGAPAPVTGLSTAAGYSNAVTLNWSPSTTAGVTYNIYAATSAGINPSLQTLVAQGIAGNTYQQTGLQPSTTYFYTVLASNYGGESAAANSVATTLAPGNSTGLQLNAGGYAAGTYMTSGFVAGGNTNYHPGTPVNTAQVANPAPAVVYDTERWGPAAWTITGLNPGGGYNVTLHFAELAHQAAGQRNFNVLVNSAVVEQNLDIVATAGAPQTAITRTYFTHADENGIVEVQTALGTNTSYGVDLNPTVAALEIIPASGSAPVGALPGTTASLQINAGGQSSGTFVADADYTSGTATTGAAAVNTAGIANAAPPVVYTTQRQGGSTYVLTGLAADTTYTLRLHFVETGTSVTGATIAAPKQRVFNVAVNGAPVLQNLDLFAEAGLNTALVQQFSANADAYGQLIVQLQNGTADQPTIAGIEAVQASATAVAVPTALTATAIPGTIDLAWSPSSTASAIYTVYRAVAGAAPAVLVSGIVASTYADSTAVAGTTYTYFLVATFGSGRSFPSNSASATALALPTNASLLAINAGGGAAAGFKADTDYTGGGTYSSLNTIAVSGVANAAPVAVYQSERSGTFTYTLAGLTPGAAYTVRLHFAEIWFQTAGQRIFNVEVNGAAALTNFDIVAIAGPNTALVRDIAATADRLGHITVSFLRGFADQPKISGIEALGAAASALPMPAENLTATPTSAGPVTLNWLASATPGVAYNVYASTSAGFTPAAATLVATGLQTPSFIHADAAAATTYFYEVQATNTAGGSTYTAQASATTAGCTACTSLIAINAGGPSGNGFAADTGFTGGGTSSVQHDIATQAVINAAPAAVYQTDRAGNFTYTLSGLTPGSSYAVRFHFAETYFTTPGQRLFNIAINTTTVLSNFDIIAAAGGEFLPLVEQFAATADNNGTITLGFTSGARDQPKVNAIELLTH